MTFRRAVPADTAVLRAMMAGSNGYERPAGRAMIAAFAESWVVPDGEHEVWIAEAGGVVAGFHALIPHGQDLETRPVVHRQ